MKRTAFFLFIVAWVFLGMGNLAISQTNETKVEALTEDRVLELIEEQKQREGVCPETNMDHKCMDCHIMAGTEWRVKEFREDAWREYPDNDDMWVSGDSLHWRLDSDISHRSCDKAGEFFAYADLHGFDHVVIELLSPGGSLFHASKIVSLMQEWRGKKEGRIVETRCYGYAFSAAFYLFSSGTVGHRYASPLAEFMWHELWLVAFSEVKTPSRLEDQARIFRALQDTVQHWLASRSDYSKEELDELIDHDEMWLNGQDMIDLGFADKLLFDF